MAVKVMQGNPDVGGATDSFVGARGLRIHRRMWLPASAPTGVVVIAHGFAEHGGRYAPLADRLVTEGLAVVAPDHRGHGLSEGKRTSVVRFSDYIDDLATVVDSAHERWASLRLILLGHSMGGLIALGLAVRPGAALDGLVLSAPAACPPVISKIQMTIGQALSRLAPNVGVSRLPLNRISRDPAVVEAYNNDPLVFRAPIRARLGTEMIATMEVVETALPSLRVPLLVMQGTSDGLVDPGCGPHVYERAGSPDKTLKMYDGLWHEIFNEPERDHVIDDLTGWLQSHLG
jgi:acylglycerol lipase